MRLRNVALLVLGAVTITSAALAQGNQTGTISGQVVSQDDQPLPGVTVSVSSPSLQGGRTTTTSTNGDYILTFLPAGDYEVSFELSGFQTAKRSARLAIAQKLPLSVSLGLSSVTETIVVEATAGSGDFTQTATVSSSYKADLVEKLPLNRGIEQAALLAPGIQGTGPAIGSNATARGAITVSGSTTFESLFLINGVVVNENLRGQGRPLFIEDAVQETTTSTAAISAEFGRFAGGVVQTITKSGGNELSGSFRTTFNNDSWRETTPFGETKRDKTVPTYEATLGGPFVKDRLWFFGAWRAVDDSVANQTRVTNIPFSQDTIERRYEGKLTWRVFRDHTLKGSFSKLSSESTNQFFTAQPVLDQASLYDRRDPEDLLSLNYTGVLSPSFFVEAQFSRRRLTFEDSGSRYTDLVRGTLLIDQQRLARYNSPTFCAACGPPETRDNQNLLLKASYFVSTSGLGSHQFVGGFDAFNDQRFANNHQSGSDYRIFTTTALVRGTDVFPVLGNDGTTVIRWTPIFTQSLGNNIRTYSAFLNDSWRLSSRLTLNLGVRYDRNDAEDSVGTPVVKDDAFSPRLSATFDPTAEGTWTLNGSYAKYVAAIANSFGDSGSSGGIPATIDFLYQGPAVNVGNPATPVSTEQALNTLFDWFFANGGTNRATFGAPSIPGLTTVLDERLASPNVRELTLGVTRRLGSRGLARIDGVYREFRDFYSRRTDLSTGRVTNDRGQVFDRSVLDNTNLEKRRYKGLNAQISYRPLDRLNLGGNYTLSRAYGTFDGENRASGPIPSTIEHFPEYREASWNTPEGDLSVDRRHRGRLWAVYDVPIPARAGALSIGALQSLDSGLPYGAVGIIDSRPYVTNPGYVNPPGPPGHYQYFFTARDAFRTEGVKRTDVNLNYAFRFKGLGKRTELFFRGTVINLFNGTAIFDNNSNRIAQTVQTRTNNARLQAFDPFNTAPVRGVHWDLPANFGQPLSREAYQLPRSYSFSAGFRF